MPTLSHSRIIVGTHSMIARLKGYLGLRLLLCSVIKCLNVFI